MIVTDRFVFVHMHKTGGQTVNRIIEECIPGHRVIGYHYPIAERPGDAADLPVVGIVRNPWDWYVSWYAFNRRPGVRNPLFEVVSDGGTADFATTLASLVGLGDDEPGAAARRRQLKALLPETLAGNRGVGLTRADLGELARSGQGYLSWLCERMLGRPDGKTARIGRFENLEHDFVSIMDDLGVPETAAIRAAFARHERANTSRHSHYSHYYSDDLRDLVARRERTLIDAFRYRFDQRRPAGTTYEFPTDGNLGDTPDFRKLLGREENFLRLSDPLDVSGLREKVEQISAERWGESDRQRIFNVHRDTQSLSLVHFEDFKYETPEHRDLYAEFHGELEPIIGYIADYYSDNGFVVRALFAKLAADGAIPAHTDAGYSLMNCHRVHIPLITSDAVEFVVGRETIRMRQGELWEINNATTHGVRNRGTDDRVHLIIDWMPNPRGKSEAAVLKADDLEDADRVAASRQALSSMIGQALELERSGQIQKAESLYRQVLHFDADHVVANNLLGLVCLKTGRSAEAAEHIGHALVSAPDDAQAHANLGLALKECGRMQDAVRHLQESLRIAPGNPRVQSNLGSLLMMLDRPEDAVDCFRSAVAGQPGVAAVHFNLGSALMQLGRYAEAATSFERCVALRPDFVEARTRLGVARQRAQSAKTPH